MRPAFSLPVARFWLAAVVALAFACLADAAELPVLTGRVVDRADLIDAATETALVNKLAAFEAKSSDQLVVATIPSLEGEALEPYANRLFRAWGLGQAGQNNGVLLLVARDDRKIRIEVGYGLEGTLTDLHSKLIIDNVIVPAFRVGDFAGGIARGADEILAVLSGDAAEVASRLKRSTERTEEIPWPSVIFVTIFCVIFFGSIGFTLLAPVYGRKIAPGRYEWLGMEVDTRGSGSGGSSGRSSSSSGGWSSSGGGFSGGGGSSGGGGASGGW